MAEILVVDDEVGIRELLSEILADEGHSVMVAENATRARELRASRRPDLVLLDIWMPDADGISLLKEWSANGLLTMPVVMMSGHGTIDTAVEATRLGAFDFVEKPFSDNALVDRIVKALEISAAAIERRRSHDGLRKALAELTDREREVMRLVIEGRPNKLIADALNISVRTVEVHRARVFDKMQVKSAVELANLLRAHGQLPAA